MENRCELKSFKWMIHIFLILNLEDLGIGIRRLPLMLDKIWTTLILFFLNLIDESRISVISFQLTGSENYSL